jgi:hypothetical protein
MTVHVWLMHSHKLSPWTDLADWWHNKHKESPDQLCPFRVLQSATHCSNDEGVGAGESRDPS